MIHGIIPLADVLVGQDDSNPPDSAMQALAQAPYYKWIAHAFIPLQYMAFGLLDYQYSQRELPWYNRLGIALTAGIGSGIAINTAHELGHTVCSENKTTTGNLSVRIQAALINCSDTLRKSHNCR